MRISDWSSTCALPVPLVFAGLSKPKCDCGPIGSARRQIGKREQIAEHEQGPFPAVRLAPGDGDRRQALRREHEPGEKGQRRRQRSEEHTSELQQLMRNPSADLCLKTKNKHTK